MNLFIGETIKQYREKKKISRQDFASLIGVSDSSISNWEKGHNRPDLVRVVKICEVLDLSSDILLGVHITNINLTAEEKELIEQYRKKPELKSAISILLGLKD